MNLLWLLGGNSIDRLKNKCKFTFGFRSSDEVIFELISFYFAILLIFHHDLMPRPIESDIFKSPDLKIEAFTFTHALNGFHFHLRYWWLNVQALADIFSVGHDSDIEPDFLLPVEWLECSYHTWVYEMLFIFIAVNLFGVAIKLSVDFVLAMIQYYSECLWALNLCTYYLFVPEVL